jgi:hypothetical protein
MAQFLRHYTEVMTDPAHFAAEITMMLIVDVLFLGLIWPLLRRAIDRRVRARHPGIDGMEARKPR